AAALRPRRQPREQDTAVGSAAGETKTRDVENVDDLRLLAENRFNAFCNAQLVRKRGAFGRLNRYHEEPLIFIGDKRGRRGAEEEERGDQRAREKRGHDVT